MSEEARFNLNLLDLTQGEIDNALFIAMVDGVPKRYRLTSADVAAVTETYTTVYQRGVTQKPNGDPIDFATDSVPLPTGWENMKRLIIYGIYENTRRWIASWDIADFVNVGLSGDDEIVLHAGISSNTFLIGIIPNTGQVFGDDHTERILIVS